MLRITIENERGEKLDLILSPTNVNKDKIIDMMYPHFDSPGTRQGYISLVNHLYNGRTPEVIRELPFGDD